MNVKAYYYHLPDTAARTNFARKCGTSFGNFQNIALYQKSVSARLASIMEEQSGGLMSLREILFPEQFEKPELQPVS